MAVIPKSTPHPTIPNVKRQVCVLSTGLNMNLTNTIRNGVNVSAYTKDSTIWFGIENEECASIEQARMMAAMLIDCADFLESHKEATDER